MRHGVSGCADAPPSSDAADGPGRCVHVLEMCRRWDDLVTLDDNVRGEGSNGRVIAASENPKPYGKSGGFIHGLFLMFRNKWSGLRGLGCDRVALPTTHWDEENTLIQELVSIVVRSNDDP
jgi:hypothetical protein